MLTTGAVGSRNAVGQIIDIWISPRPIIHLTFVEHIPLTRWLLYDVALRSRLRTLAGISWLMWFVTCRLEDVK
jgi:hypothetical protein